MLIERRSRRTGEEGDKRAAAAVAAAAAKMIALYGKGLEVSGDEKRIRRRRV